MLRRVSTPPEGPAWMASCHPSATPPDCRFRRNSWSSGSLTQKIGHSPGPEALRLIARCVALVFNWWTLFALLTGPDHHRDAITSRPLLLTPCEIYIPYREPRERFYRFPNK